jgi:glycosyltransferase involved in cell wall biosynthesis
MKFSIIVPVYNVEKYLVQCIESLLTQDYSDYEIILIDDLSLDSSSKIIDTYARKFEKIVAIHNEVNLGYPELVFLKGAEIASGDYLCLVNADDYVTPTFLSNYANNSQNGNIDIVLSAISKTYVVGDSVTVIPPKTVITDSKEMAEQAKSVVCFIEKPETLFYWCVSAVKKSIIQKIVFGSFPRRLVGGDVLLIAMYALNASSLVYDGVSCDYFWRQRVSALSKSGFKQRKESMTPLSYASELFHKYGYDYDLDFFVNLSPLCVLYRDTSVNTFRTMPYVKNKILHSRYPIVNKVIAFMISVFGLNFVSVIMQFILKIHNFFAVLFPNKRIMFE